MDASVFSFRNNSNEVQEFSIFESSALSGSTNTLETVWNFEADYFNIYNGDNKDEWWESTAVNSPGSFGIRMFKTDGSTFTINQPTIAALSNLSTPLFMDYLNDNANIFAQIGVWSAIGPSGPEGNNFIIRCSVNENFIITNEIASQDPTLNYGVESIDLAGSNLPIAEWTEIQVFPSVNQVGPALVSNPNISVVTTSNFPYQDFLWSSIQRTYDIKNFQIFSINQQQLLQPFLFDRTLATGKVYQKVLTPTIDPYQSQNYIVTPDGKGYILDGFTKIKYSLLPNTQVRLILDYTYIDISTPLIASLREPEINKDFITPEFVDNIEKGYDKFGCDFLIERSKYLSKKVQWLLDGKPTDSEFYNVSGSQNRLGNSIASSDTGNNPKWQEQIKSKLIYIKKLMINYDCFPKEEIEKMPQFGVVVSTFVRNDLWMPSPEFVQHQLDTEQGARKLFGKHDFPIEKE